MPQPSLSIVIPTLNAAAQLPGCLATLREAGRQWPDRLELLVVDGGSDDGTKALAAAAGAALLDSAPGRGVQLARGAREARGKWLLFLHADSRLEAGWSGAVAAWMAQARPRDQAAYFTLRFDSRAPAARRLERLVRWRNDRFQLPYGDQGLLITRRLYRRVGGYGAEPLMEDVALVRRLRRAPPQPNPRAIPQQDASSGRVLVRLPVAVTTSAARYEREGWLWRALRNLTLLLLYFLGLPPRRLVGFYAARNKG
tara:strand:- start:2331 stop:3095 length:765 start_codon:yes stop_codon:yes gene_type:complete